MSELILVRHGQATPFQADTDQLSPLGEAQARAVGEALAAQGVRPTHVLHGSLVRQRRTAELAAAPDWPAPTLDPRLSEYDGDGLVRTLAPLLAERDPALAALSEAFAAQRGGPERNRAFQKYLEALAAAWQAGTLTHPEVEGWADFQGRVRSALADLLRLPSGSTVLAFTSGGVIGLMVALALDAPGASALALNWRVKNGSVTRLTFGGGRLSLDSFNEIHHLSPELRSWR
ncbi:histidine phosphatase family protein [Deinococcus koreensis]|uniref:Histidine phosphatase family protein n=1 Tax=Deinococcus koreensis TaxID=2054903 RepID=A0A2K3USX1_9DEIO|nr:histidine phosphatase family protein [Deinococcus koreensis]PNY79636.1 histidine phosphatase family protein [Deinococcus koreensis]